MRFFQNRKEIIIRDTEMSWGYFRFRDFRMPDDVSLNPEQIIHNFIKSIYFLWQDKKLDKVPYMINGKKTTVDWNFHGIYDAAKIVPSDFIAKPYEVFKKEFFDFVNDKLNGEVYYSYKNAPTEIKKSMNEMERIINECNNADNTFYILSSNDKEKLHQHSVYAFFISAVMINLTDRTFVTIEFGFD